MSELQHTVFVYGTLKRGQGNHYLLDHKGAQFVSEATTVGSWLMYDGGFPRVARLQRGLPKDHFLRGRVGHVKGEVFKVDEPTFMALDRLEGYPRLYDREKVSVVSGEEPGESYWTAWMYVIVQHPRHEPMVPINGKLAWRTSRVRSTFDTIVDVVRPPRNL